MAHGGPRKKCDPERVSRGILQQGRVVNRLRLAARVRKHADDELKRLVDLAREVGVDEATIRQARQA